MSKKRIKDLKKVDKEGFYWEERLSRKSASSINEKRYRCEICGKKFTDNFLLRYHYMRTHFLEKLHTGEKPMGCGLCEEKFSILSEFNVHIRGHIREKPFKCEICEKKYNSFDGLNMHMMEHTGEKLCRSGVRKEKFTLSSKVRNHTKKRQNMRFAD